MDARRCPRGPARRSARRSPAETTWTGKGNTPQDYQPGEVAVDRLWLPAGVSEDGAIGHRANGAMGRNQGQGGGLDAEAVAEGAQPDRRRRRLGRRAL